MGELLEAIGVAGVGFTVTLTVPAAEVQPPTVTVTEYTPDMATVETGRDGFCNAEVNPPGPVHAYVAPVTNAVVRFIVCPAHSGELLPGEGVVGVGFTTTFVVPAAEVQPLTVTVTE